MSIVILNGERRDIEGVSTLKELLAKMELNAPYLAIAINDKVVPRSERELIKVKDGDRIEVIHAVGGG